MAGTTLAATVCNDFVRRLPGAHALRMLRVVLVGFCGFSPNSFKRSASADMVWATLRDRDGREQTTWIKQSLLQRYVCVGCQQALRILRFEHIELPAKLLDYFLRSNRSNINQIWKDTSECVARRCDDNVDKKRVNSCVLKKPHFGGGWATKKIAKKPWKCSLRRATNVTFSKFRG